MSASVILSILALYTSGFLFIWAGIAGLKKFSENEGQKFFLFALIITGITLGPFMGTRNILGILGYEKIDLIFSIIDYFWVALLLVCFLFYFAYKNLSSKYYRFAKRFLTVFLFLVLLMLLFGVWDTSYTGPFVTGPHISKWGTEYELTAYVEIIFGSIWALLVGVTIYSLVRCIFQSWENKKIDLDLYINLTFFLFLFFFLPESLGRMNTWKLVFSRITSNIIAVAFFLIYTKEYWK